MPNILVESKILYGDPANEICKLAEDINADMVVIGAGILSLSLCY
jgi:Universal stress protein family.